MKLGMREVIFLIVVLTIPVGAWWFVFRPKNAHHEEMVREIEARQAKLRELNKATATLGDLKKEIADLDEGVPVRVAFGRGKGARREVRQGHVEADHALRLSPAVRPMATHTRRFVDGARGPRGRASRRSLGVQGEGGAQ